MMKSKKMPIERENANSILQNPHAVPMDVTAPPKKKLKQARLPFQVLSPGVGAIKSNKKRKLSDSSDDIKVIKVVRPNETANAVKTKTPFSNSAVQTETIPDENCRKNVITPVESNSISSIPKSSVQVLENVASSKTVCNYAVKLDINSSDYVITLSDSENGFDSKSPLPESSSDGLENLSSEVISSSGHNAAEKVLDTNAKKKVVGKTGKTAKTDVAEKMMSIERKPRKRTIAKTTKMDAAEKMLRIERKPRKKTVAKTTKMDAAEQILNIERHPRKKTVAKTSKTDAAEKILSIERKPAKKTMAKTTKMDLKVSDWLNLCTSNLGTSNKSEEQADLKQPILTSSKHSNITDVEASKVHLTPKLKSQPEYHVDMNMGVLKTPNQIPPDCKPNSTPIMKKLTPKQLQKQVESVKKREEKDKLKQEREKKRAEEKEDKQRQKQEKDDQKKKEREEKEEHRKKRLAETEFKSEEKKAKDEEKKKKEEQRLAEKRKREEAEEEAKRKKSKEAAVFTSFFRPKKSDLKPTEDLKPKMVEHFMPFQVKGDMRIAPLVRTMMTGNMKLSLEDIMLKQTSRELYLDELKRKVAIPGKSTKTWPLSDLKDIIIIDIDDEMASGNDIYVSQPTKNRQLHPKLFLFWENRRPPYWGTWQKKSKIVRPRCPFGKEEKLFDYDVDSDDEWEEEEPGESLRGSEDEKESEDEYEVDNEFFVPHGYLSDEENNEEEDNSPETQKVKLKLLELEFEKEMKHKTERIKPRLVGCVWYSDSDATTAIGAHFQKLLGSLRAVYRESPISMSPPAGVSHPSLQMGSSNPKTSKKKKFPEEAVPALIRLVHGNINSRVFLVKEFAMFWSKEQVDVNQEIESPATLGLYKSTIVAKINEFAKWVACPDEGAMNGRMCWYVPQSVREAHDLSDLAIPNQLWNYNLKPRRRESEVLLAPSPVPAENSPRMAPLITNFTKKMSQEECKKQFQLIEVQALTPPPAKHSPRVTPLITNFTRKMSQEECKKQFQLVESKLESPVRTLDTWRKPLFTPAKPPSAHPRKRVPILVSVARGQEIPAYRHPPQSTAEEPSKPAPQVDSVSILLGQQEMSSGKDQTQEFDCIVLD